MGLVWDGNLSSKLLSVAELYISFFVFLFLLFGGRTGERIARL